MKGLRLLATLWIFTGLILLSDVFAVRVSPDWAKIKSEKETINILIKNQEIDKLIEMLPTVNFENQVTIAEYLGENGDEKAIPALMRLNETNGGWIMAGVEDWDHSGAFAVSICKILTKKLPDRERAEALFELLEGKGPAVPDSNELRKIKFNVIERKFSINFKNNIWVGACVATELEKYHDPSIIARLRKSDNRGVVEKAVWMEVRDMNKADAIARCVQIAIDEDYDQRYGAIMCLSRFGNDAIKDLNELAVEGFSDAIEAMSKIKNPEIQNIFSWHLLNNRNSFVRTSAVHYMPHSKSTIPVLIQALYDPSEMVRRFAISRLDSISFGRSDFDSMLEESMLTATKHPDKEVRERAREILNRMKSTRSSESVPAPPPFRSDLEAKSKIPVPNKKKTSQK